MIVTKTSVVATVGPACSQQEILLEMVKNGVTTFRLNFSHGSYDDHAEVIKNIRELNDELGLNVSILADLQGPKIRTHEMENNGVNLIPGNELLVLVEKVLGTAEKISINEFLGIFTEI